MIEGFFALIFGLISGVMGLFWLMISAASLALLWAVILPFALLWGWMLARILQRAGYSGWWALIGFTPLLPLAVWIFAFSSWPAAARTVVLMPPERRY